jgi:hypothetical protein
VKLAAPLRVFFTRDSVIFLMFGEGYYKKGLSMYQAPATTNIAGRSSGRLPIAVGFNQLFLKLKIALAA